MFKSLKWRLVSIFFLLTMSVVISIGTFLIYSVENSYKDEFITQLKLSEEEFLQMNLAENVTYESEDYENELFKVFKYKFAIDNIYRKGYLLDGNGNVILSSDLSSSYNALNSTYVTKTPNIITAMVGSVGNVINKNSDFLDYANPIVVDGEVKYILYLMYNSEGIDNVLSSLKNMIFVSVLFSLAVSIVLGYVFSKAITDPITKLTNVSEKMAEGDFGSKVEIKSMDEIGKLSKSFNYMAGELQLTLESRKEFVANVSHELKTPITSIKTYSETLMSSNLEDKDIAMKFIRVINSEADRMARIVSDLLQLSRFDYNQKVWNKVELDLGALALDIASQMRIQAEQKKQEINCEVMKPGIKVLADRDGIVQVLTNIISNSIKYTFMNGTIKIIVDVDKEERPILQVIDDGIGIPKEDLPKIFERFYRVDKGRSREMGGTGLGLSIAKEIVEANDAKIKVESEQKKGTTVTVIFNKKV